MIQLLVRRIGMMILIMLVVALLLFLINEGDPQLIARSVLGPYAQPEQLQAWVIENGYDRSVFIRYFEWIGRLFAGDLGDSVIYKRPVSEIFWDRLGNTGILAGVTFVLMVLIALTLGVLAGMKEGSLQDRAISVFSIVTTSIPEYASAVFLVGVFVFWLGWLPGTSSMTSGFDPVQMILPVLVLTLYGFGYIARMTRASMAEVMTTPYIRTAVLKGLALPPHHHAARAAERADRALHRDHAADQLAALGRGRDRVRLRLQGLRRAAAGGGAPARHLRHRGLRHGSRLRRRLHPDRGRSRLHLSEPEDPLQMSDAPRMSDAVAPVARLGASFASALRPIALLRESPVGMIGGAIVLVFVVLAVFAEFIAPFDPNDAMVPFAYPGAEAPDGRIFLLGTDHLGRDILSRIIWGGQRVLFYAAVATILAYVVGIVMGLAAGYFRGYLDELLSFVANVILSFPIMVLYVLIIAKGRRVGAQHHLRRRVRVFAGHHAHRARGDDGHRDPRLHRRGADPRRGPLVRHAGGDPAQCARAADRRFLPAHGLHDHHHRGAGLPRPRPAAAGPPTGAA